MINNALILGHRGSRKSSLENSLQSFLDAQSLIKPNHMGMDGVEFDIQFTRDQNFCVFHDDDLVRLANRQSRIDELTIHQISQIHLYDKQHNAHTIPTLSNMPALLHGYRHIELEIKTHARTPHQALALSLIKNLSPFAYLPITLTSFDPIILRLLHNKTPFALGLLAEQNQDIHTLIDTAHSVNATRIGLYYPLINQEVVRLCHHHDLKITAWTVNDANIAKTLQNLGVDVIISDVPRLLIHALKS